MSRYSGGLQGGLGNKGTYSHVLQGNEGYIHFVEIV